jgi:CRISPR/Cas system CMR-associated protein Cmr5 small subunit
MDMTTYKKVKGTLDPKDKASVTITGDKPPVAGSTSTSSTTTMEENAPESVIEPKDKETIKYLSNVKDSKTGEISKPFSVGEKKYQMVRGTHPKQGTVLAVYCHDDIDENGDNVIHPMEYFEENIANPMKEQMGMVGQDIAVAPKTEDYAADEREFHDKEAFMDYLNLVGLEGYKHFFVNTKTGKVIAQFKSTKEMAKSGIKLGPDEDYMDIKTLKRYRFGDYFKPDVNEIDSTQAPNSNDQGAGTNVNKLQSDVKKLANMIKNKFSVYLSKLDKPIEQAQFLTAMASEIGVPLNKLSSIITTFKDLSKDQEVDNTKVAGLKAERKIMTKNQLEESLKTKKVIKIIKVKDIK